MDARSHWDRVYSTHAAEDVSWFQPHAQQSLALIERITGGLPCSVIDVGAGASTLVDDLVARGDAVTVLDVSSAALDVARRRLGPAAAGVHWQVGDITTAPLLRGAYDIWHDRAVFHFLTDAGQRTAYVAQVRHAVRPGGHVIVAAFGPDGPLACSGLPVVRYSPESLHAQFGGAFELVEHTTESHRTPAGTAQQFVYCHCVLH